MHRFVILYHQMPPASARPDHWDLMLESPQGFLWTWALPPSLLTQDAPIVATQLDHHRLAYLDYEGPISNDRGSVHRIDAGHYHWLTHDDAGTPLEVWLHGATIRGRLRLTRMTQEHHWVLQLESNPEVAPPFPGT